MSAHLAAAQLQRRSAPCVPDGERPLALAGNYAELMPRLGYPAIWEYGGGLSVGWLGRGGSFWIKQAADRYRGETFSKERVGLCEVALRAESREHADELARELERKGVTILDPPREYPEYVPGYYAVFFADPDGIKLELVYIPG